MTRLLFIVARDEPGLLEFLRRDFAAEEAQGDIEILMDRRASPRRQAVPPGEAEGRDWNRNRAVGESLRELGCAFVPQQPSLPSA
jgi:hypothetical protein